MTSFIRRPAFWLLIILVALITVAHYSEAIEHIPFLTDLMGKLGLDRHAFERIL